MNKPEPLSCALFLLVLQGGLCSRFSLMGSLSRWQGSRVPPAGREQPAVHRAGEGEGAGAETCSDTETEPVSEGMKKV